MKNVARARMERAAWVLVLGRGGCCLVEDGWVVIVHFVVIHIYYVYYCFHRYQIIAPLCVCVGHDILLCGRRMLSHKQVGVKKLNFIHDANGPFLCCQHHITLLLVQ